jgi:hypothetical protein
MFKTNAAAKDFKFIEIGYDEDKYFESAVLYSLAELTPEKPFVVTWIEWGALPRRGISFSDENNVTRYFYLARSGENGDLLLAEFK